MKRGRFIVLEGTDLSGKSTQAALLARALKRRGVPVLHTREPGGTPLAEALRKVLLDPAHPINPLAELFLYEAARAQHVQETIRPALKRGLCVLCERYTLATVAYQGYGRGIALASVRALNRIAAQGLRPDRTFLLDLPTPGPRRRARAPDRIEREGAAFQRRVRRGYLSERGASVVVLDARRPVEELHRELLGRALRLLTHGL